MRHVWFSDSLVKGSDFGDTSKKSEEVDVIIFENGREQNEVENKKIKRIS